MLKKEMLDALNAQINLEFYSSNLYLQMSAWAQSKGLEGAARFLKSHAGEEMSHMDKFFSFINETGGMAILGTLAAPPTAFDSVKDMFEQILEHEQLVTSKINDLAALAFGLKDFTTFNFLQYFIAEQLEEESIFGSILDKIKIIGVPEKGLYLFDKELARMDAEHHGTAPTPAE
ncbi:MAG: non-heme ferritin [Candidatus Eisenbacteria bacterium]|uniref:Ferritin n=1 Tax=Eiseniibacteriota bacterium TaxID=2212470 RepID=A0A948RYD9_UNCEI|nr:non-heme ferritin [Candidatus Eisenbacteria bacterium]MBU1949820.1 non-heme ferritin [Candidatus Eisenbacteria bacterium]MBU2692721.1 non-heme ferritin [Candidatus Eisenbacteria bacterium]